MDTFTGTGAELVRTLTDAGGSAVKPGLVWIKDRDTAVEHVLVDEVRGATKEWFPNGYAVETTAAQGVKSFDTSGYTLGTDTSYNATSSLNVAWCWVVGGSSGSANTDGSSDTITTSVNTTSGISISTWTGSGVARTFGHGLGAIPAFGFVRKIGTSGDNGAHIYHHKNTAAPETDYLDMQSNAATADDANEWNDTAPTSTVFSVKSSGGTNANNHNYVGYWFKEIEGYSKFGGYEGNGSTDGTFVWCGFRPAFILAKNMDAAGDWNIYDNERAGYNVANYILAANEVQAETTGATLDFLSNGFKLRTTSTPNQANTFVFAAFAEFPFGGDGVGQARAR